MDWSKNDDDELEIVLQCVNGDNMVEVGVMCAELI